VEQKGLLNENNRGQDNNIKIRQKDAEQWFTAENKQFGFQAKFSGGFNFLSSFKISR
jgi:hypothetical protein